MANFAELDNVAHADLTVGIAHGATYGDAVNQLIVFPTEFEQVQRDFPILFRRDENAGYYSVALLGLDLDENLFLGEKGWTTRYVPSVQQRGPFHYAADGSTVMIDLDDRRVGAAGGEPLYLRHGGAAPYLQHVTAVLDAVKRGSESLSPFFAALEGAALIRPIQLDIELADGTTYSIADIFTVDEERLTRLDGPALERLSRGGLLRAAIMAASSLGNVTRLIELKNRANGLE